MKGERGYYVKVLLLITALIAYLLIISVSAEHPQSNVVQSVTFEGRNGKTIHGQKMRRMAIGSTAPICTHNECRGCKFRCRAEQVPVDGNDPINSAYRYKCICHR
ncbi:hypothetical protein RND81_11G187500 [Saponaria officinalis]|uniref:Stomagen C-terminal domain-containing protein n=1 Tax=Saponaria officinalis TaxID=3572 RepID=A0AAW1HPE4_SAPOF